MGGDTVTIWAAAFFNIDAGPKEEIQTEFKIIVDDYYGID